MDNIKFDGAFAIITLDDLDNPDLKSGNNFGASTMTGLIAFSNDKSDFISGAIWNNKLIYGGEKFAAVSMGSNFTGVPDKIIENRTLNVKENVVPVTEEDGRKSQSGGTRINSIEEGLGFVRGESRNGGQGTNTESTDRSEKQTQFGMETGFLSMIKMVLPPFVRQFLDLIMSVINNTSSFFLGEGGIQKIIIIAVLVFITLKFI
jgi:hypothetical protein